MSATWTFPEFVDELAAAIDALPALDLLSPRPEVRVSVPHAAEDISDAIVFGIDAIDDKEQIALGSHSHDETVTVGCMAAAVRYGSGDTEAKAARDRAVALVALVDDYLRETKVEVGVKTLYQRVGGREFESFPSSVGEDSPVRVARVQFDIIYRARTDAT